MEAVPGPVRALWEELDGRAPTYLVGGCVRDALLGLPPHDWDLTTALRPEQVIRAVGARGWRALETGIAFGTVTVLTPLPVEVTTFRSEGAYHDHRRPESVEFGTSVEEDLRRRDFTINALALNRAGGLCDPCGGRADLEAGILRAVGDPLERFREDALRMWRAVRFIAEGKARTIEDGTRQALLRLKAQTALLSRERVRDELSRVLLARPEGLLEARATGLLALAIPEWAALEGFDQRNHHHDRTVADHTAAAVAYAPQRLELRLAALLHDIAKPQCMVWDGAGDAHYYEHAVVGGQMSADILVRLRYPKETVRAVAELVHYHMFDFAQASPRSLRRLGRKIGWPRLRALCALHEADFRAVHRERAAYRLPVEVGALIDSLQQEDETSPLAVDGRDVMAALGIGPGPRVGRALRACRAVVDRQPERNDRATLLEVARRAAGRP